MNKIQPWCRSGARVAVFCPCGPPHREKTRRGLQWLQEQGYQPLLSPLLERWLAGAARPPLPYLAGSDPERVDDILWALEGVDAEVAWAVRGGYGLTRILGDLKPQSDLHRPVIGFSDLTALFSRLQQLGWEAVLHGPNVQSLALAIEGGESLEPLHKLLTQGELPEFEGQTWLPGADCEGVAAGGNLCVLASLCGTPQQPVWRDTILFLEDVTEHPYRLDRYLTQLHSSGAMVGVQAIALGEFSECGEESEIRASITETVRPWNIPVVGGLPFGHGARNQPLPLGLRARLRGERLSFF